MEVERDDGIMQALRCVAAMEGQDSETRLSLWKAAVKFHQRGVTRPAGEKAERVFAHNGWRGEVSTGGGAQNLGVEW